MQADKKLYILLIWSFILSGISYVWEMHNKNKIATQISFSLVTIIVCAIQIPELIKIIRTNRKIKIQLTNLFVFGLLFLLSGNNIKLEEYPIYYIMKTISSVLCMSTIFKAKYLPDRN